MIFLPIRKMRYSLLRKLHGSRVTAAWEIHAGTSVYTFFGVGTTVTSGQKTAVSLLLTIILFAAFILTAFSGLFSFIEARFYQPVKIAGIQKQLDGAADCLDSYIQTLVRDFTVYADDAAVKSYLESKPEDTDVQNRTQLTGKLLAGHSGLEGIRILGLSGGRIHFSTYKDDVLRQTDSLVSYKVYTQLPGVQNGTEPAAESLLVPEGSSAAVLMDGMNGRIIISCPFYDGYTVYRGSIVFYLSETDFSRELVSRNLVTLSQSCGAAGDFSGGKGGVVLGLPAAGASGLKKLIVEKWASGVSGPEKLEVLGTENDASSVSMVLMTSGLSSYGYVSAVYPESLFVMSVTVRVLLLACVFISIFLVLFLLLNIKHDDITVVQDVIRKFQLSLLSEYLEKKEPVEWSAVASRLESQKDDVSRQIKRALGIRNGHGKGGKKAEKIDALLESGWTEIIQALRSGQSAPQPLHAGKADTDEIKRLLQQLLAEDRRISRAVSVPVPAAAVSSGPVVTAERPQPADAEPVEEIEPLEPADAEPVEEVEPLEPADAEPVEDVEPLESADIEPVEDVEPLEPADAEPVEEIEPLEPADAEPVEEVEPLEPADAEPVEEVELLEPADAEPLSPVVVPAPVLIPRSNIPAALRRPVIPVALSAHEFSDTLITPDVAEAVTVEEIEPLEPADEPDILPAADDIPAAEPADDAASPEPLSPGQKNPFSFTGFGAVRDVAGALEPVSAGQAIVVDESGISRISDSLDVSSVRQDTDFKKLIESVLKG